MKEKKFRFLTYGRLSDGFKEYVDKHYPEIDCIHCESRQEIPELIKQVDSLAGFDFVRDADLSHIRWYHSFAAGVDTLVKKTFSQDCIVTRTSGRLGPRIGEYCLAYILHDLKQIRRIETQQEQLIWDQFDLPSINDQTVMILGTGTIGEGIAKTLKGHCSEIIGVSRSGQPKPDFDSVLQFNALGDHPEIDVAINALPLTTSTREIIKTSIFKKFKDVLFINVGRGATLSEIDLQAALESGSVRAAVLDVFTIEPLPKDSPFWKHPRVIVTPHHSGLTTIEDVIDSFERVYSLVKSGTTNELFVDLQRQY